MQCLFVIDRNFFAGLDVAEREEEYVAVEDLHVGIRLARMVDVMRAIAAAAAVPAPAMIDGADPQHPAILSPPRSLGIGNQLASILSDLFPTRKAKRCETTSAVDR